MSTNRSHKFFLLGSASMLGASAALASADYGPAVSRMITACTKWYTSGYGHHFCVIHDMEGYYLSTISYLQHCNNTVSIYYAVNGLTDYSGDAAPGEISQLVREADYAWHVGCWNLWMFGTEHEGFVSNPAWYTEAMYQSSSLLQRHLCDNYGIPKDRNHIIAHGEWQNGSWVNWMHANYPSINTGCNSHTDPGPYWNWGHFMDLIIGGTDNAAFVSQTVANGTSFSPGQGFSCTWTMNNNGTTTWVANGQNGYTLNYVSGTQMGAPTINPIGGNVGPGGNASIGVGFTAPSSPGSYSVVFQMNNSAGNFFGQQVSVSINVVNPAPTITAQPQNTTVNPGQTATLTVGASGATGYQWRKNGVNLSNGGNISGATSATLNIANAQLGDAGFYSVVASNSGGSVTSQQAQLVVTATAVVAGNGAGLRGLYYNNLDFTSLKVARLDATVNFDWGTGSPDGSIGADQFSVRWLGQVQPRYSQTYTFYTVTDDGARLWVNGQLLVNHWNDQGATEWSGTLALTAGQKYDIQMDYYENGGGASAQLSWSSASQLKEVIPQGQLYRPAPVLAAIPAQTVAEGALLSLTATPVAWDQVAAVTPMEDFESFSDGTPNDQIMFRKPGNSSTTSGFLDGSVNNYDVPTASFPVGNSSTRVLHATWSFLTGTSNPWLRFDTFNSATDPNPVIDVTQSLWFDIYSDKALQVGVDVREANPTGAIGSNGGTSGTIEFVGVPSKNGGTPNPSRTVPAGSWTTLAFNLPHEPVSAFTGNGVLESTTGKGVLEALALVPAGGMGVYNVYLDNFLQVQSAGLTYSLDPGAPAGANIDGVTGVFSWTPPTGQSPATYNVTVRVTDNGSPNLSTTQTFAITVNAAPMITDQPQDQTVYPGGSATFSVGAMGSAPLAYQWLFNDAPISGATASSFTRANAQSSDSGSYAVVVTNALGSATSSEAMLMVSATNAPPSIITDPQSLTVNQGGSASFSVTVAGSVPLSYQWLLNGSAVSGATAASFTKNNVQGADAGSYCLIATNVFGSATSGVAVLTVIVPPSLVLQPQSQTVNQGSNVTFTASATGTSPLAFQWRKGGTPIGGATGTSYTRSNVQGADAGSYSVMVTNQAGTATSTNAVLAVNIPPSISAQPQSQTVSAGANVTFSVTASGTPAPSYQWRRNGLDISGATASSYARNNVQSADVGVYSVFVSNVAGSVTSADALLELNAVIIFSDDFESGNLNNWTTVASSPLGISTAQVHGGSYSAVQDSTGDYMYHNLPYNLSGHTKVNFWWYDDGASTKSYFEVRSYDGGSYLSGSLGELLAIGKYNTTTAPGESWDNHKYQLRAQYPTASYGWMNCATNGSGTGARAAGWHQFAIERLADNTTVNFSVDGVTRQLTSVGANSGHLANWSAVLLGGGSGSTAITAYWDDLVVTYYDPPSITTQPAGQTVAAGAGATFSAVATNNPMSYQWRLNGVNLSDGNGVSGSGSATLTVNNAQAGSAGTYTVVVANGAGPAISSDAVLQVAPAITSQPLNSTNLAGSTAVFSVTAGGQAPLDYQWQKNGSNILGATTATLTLVGVSQSDVGTYTVRASNSAGTADSAPAVLVVVAPPSIATQPVSQAVAAGSLVTFTVGANGTAPLSYQWRLNDAEISGATDSSYTRPNAQSADAGTYIVAVRNSGGLQDSAPAILTVNNPPALAPLGSLVIHAGSTVTFTCAASDLDAPGQNLTFSLDPGAPTAASIVASTGLFRWVTTAADAGTTNSITARVTDNGTPVLSDAKTFVITAVGPPTFLSVAASADSATLTWSAIAGQAYLVQYKNDLSEAAWSDLVEVTAAGPTVSLVDPFITDLGTIPQRFYRVLVQN